MTYETFKEKIAKTHSELSAISERYLNEDGIRDRNFYSELNFMLYFCDSFCDLEAAIDADWWLICNKGLFSGDAGEFRLRRIREWAEEERRSDNEVLRT